jgi:hypothetical protein
MPERFEPFHSSEKIDHFLRAASDPAEGADDAAGAAPDHEIDRNALLVQEFKEGNGGYRFESSAGQYQGYFGSRGR